MKSSLVADRRVQKTHEALRTALIASLVERGWDDTSVQDLCDHANIGRSTFYMHFANKEELLASGLNDLRTRLMAQADDRGESGKMPFVRGLVDHVYEQQKLFRAIIGSRSSLVVQKRFREMVVGLVKESFSLQPGGWQREAAIRYIAGALVELLTWWLEVRRTPTPDDVEHIFHQMTEAILQELSKQSTNRNG